MLGIVSSVVVPLLRFIDLFLWFSSLCGSPDLCVLCQITVDLVRWIVKLQTYINSPLI